MTVTTDDRQDAQQACERLIQDFAWHIDHHEAQQAALLFAPDGAFHRRGETLQGRQTILAALLKRPPQVTTRHLCSNIRLQIESHARIRGTSYFQLYRFATPSVETADAPCPLELPEVVGEYHDLFVKTAEGWRIADRVARAVFQRAA